MYTVVENAAILQCTYTCLAVGYYLHAPLVAGEFCPHKNPKKELTAVQYTAVKGQVVVASTTATKSLAGSGVPFCHFHPVALFLVFHVDHLSHAEEKWRRLT